MLARPRRSDNESRPRPTKWTAHLETLIRCRDKAISKTVLDLPSHPSVISPQTVMPRDNTVSLKVAWSINKEMDKWATIQITPTRPMRNRARFINNASISEITIDWGHEIDCATVA